MKLGNRKLVLKLAREYGCLSKRMWLLKLTDTESRVNGDSFLGKRIQFSCDTTSSTIYKRIRNVLYRTIL